MGFPNRINSVILIGFTIFFSCNINQDKKIVSNDIELASDTIKFNKLGFNDTLYSFVFLRNKTENIVKIIRIENACGCTSGFLNDSIIRPNDSLKVNIRYVPKYSNDKGKVLKFLSIRLDNESIPFKNIILKGEITN